MGCPQVSPAWSPSPGQAPGDVVLSGLRASRVPAGARSRSGSAKRSRVSPLRESLPADISKRRIGGASRSPRERCRWR